MKSHILIQNKGELPVWGIRLMGLSNKDANQIGQFGTGLKESIALLARMDLFPIIYSGEMRMDFSIQNMDGQDEICFMLSEDRQRFVANEWHGLGIHPDFGKADWNNPWMIFREVVCNALDESGTDDLFHECSMRQPEGVAGATRVYIPVTPEIMEAYTSINRKLLPLGDHTIAYSVSGYGRLIEKREDAKLQVFHRGVWIQEHQDESLYDYDLDGIKLNESRSCDWHSVTTQTGIVIAQFSEDQAQALLNAMLVDNRTIWERHCLTNGTYYVDKKSEAWQNAWTSIFGDNAVLTDTSAYFHDKLKRMGKTPIIVSDSGLMSFLKSAGIPHVAQVLTREDRKWDTVADPDEESQDVFDFVWNRLGVAGLQHGKEKPPLRIFTELLGSAEVTFGAYHGGTCYINRACVGSIQERRACLEELAHHISGASDESREFQMFLLEVADHFGFESVLK